MLFTEDLSEHLFYVFIVHFVVLLLFNNIIL